MKVTNLISAGVLAVNDGYRVRNVELGARGTPFVRGGDIGDNGEINTDVADHVLPKFKDRLTGKVAAPGDVAFISKGTVGRVGRLREGQPPIVFAPQVCFWRSLNPDEICPTFLYYLLTSSIFQSQLDAVRTHGSMVADYVSLADQRAFTLPIPTIDVQRAISALLGSLDDKIEQNRRTGRALEGLARATFKAWFVDFEPVKAKAAGATAFPGMPPAAFAALPDRLTESPLGPIPLGWEVGSVGSTASLSKQQIDPQENAEEAFDHYSIPAFDAGSNAVTETGGSIKSQKFVVVAESVLFSKLNPRIARVWLPPASDGRRQIASTEFLVVVPRPGWSRYFLYCLFQQEEFRNALAQSASGTSNSHQRIRPDDFLAKPVVIPTQPLRESFARQVVPLMELRAASQAESSKLATLRDYLLPRLLSGRVRVRSAETRVEAIA